MQTDLISYVVASESRKKIVRTILDNPERQWSCPYMEELTRLPHATVFRTLKDLKRLSLLKATRLSRKNIVFRMPETPLGTMIDEVLNAENKALMNMAEAFAAEIKCREVTACVLYGSVARKTADWRSDIDVLVLVKNKSKALEAEMHEKATALSVDFNKSIAPMVMTEREFRKNSGLKKRFETDVLREGVVLFGKLPS